MLLCSTQMERMETAVRCYVYAKMAPTVTKRMVIAGAHLVGKEHIVNTHVQQIIMEIVFNRVIVPWNLDLYVIPLLVTVYVLMVGLAGIVMRHVRPINTVQIVNGAVSAGIVPRAIALMEHAFVNRDGEEGSAIAHALLAIMAMDVIRFVNVKMAELVIT